MRASLVIGVSFAAVAVGLGLLGLREMQAFDNTAGRDARAAVLWPAAAPLRPPAGKPVLLLFAHPLCGCTKATLVELQQVLSEAGRAPDVRVLFEPEGKLEAPLWQQAAALPGAVVAWDSGGRIAAAFGAHTSGVVKFYDRQGMLRFEGGITSARGHEGRSTGGEALLAALRGTTADVIRFPVFGCAFQAERS